MAEGRKITVVHLVWRPLGPAVLADFVAAYGRHAAGMPHRLVVVYNGFAGEADRAPYEQLLASVAHDALNTPEPVQDLPAYLAAARAVDSEYVCFLNSYSEPLAAGWLAMLYTHAVRPSVGLVGASGSWESLSSNAVRALPLTQLHDEGLAAVARRAMRRGRDVPDLVRRYVRLRRERHETARLFDPFPSHHVRTNGFMLRRELMLALRWPAIRTKADARAFESGRDGLTRQIEARGLATLVVGRDGQGFAPADWWRSGTFRCGDQHNLLIADNRTREFDALDSDGKARVAANTWGSNPGASAPALPRPAALAAR